MTKEQISELHNSQSAEHKKILESRLQLISSGKATFKPWAEIQAKFNIV